MVRGEGVYLFDVDGKRYLDFASGIAVNSLGHCHPHLVKALKVQAETLWHCSNMYQIPSLTKLAQRLVDHSFADTVFFASSGAEAVETGLKLVRRYHDMTGHPERYRVITMTNGFHGRTLATISAGGNDIARKGYEPLVDGFDRVAFNDLNAVKQAITSETAAILIEPVQGEGGVRPATKEFLQGVRALCDAHGLLLFLDEVQCGMGRCGSLFAYNLFDVVPNIVTVAKGIGSGFPLAACLMTEAVGACVEPGSHGSTYGSNPLAMTVGNAVLDVMLERDFMAHVTDMGVQMQGMLSFMQKQYPELITGIQGIGLMWGITLSQPVMEFVQIMRRNGLLTAPAANQVVRFVPPLIIQSDHIQEAGELLHQSCEALCHA